MKLRTKEVETFVETGTVIGLKPAWDSSKESVTIRVPLLVFVDDMSEENLDLNLNVTAEPGKFPYKSQVEVKIGRQIRER